MGPDALRLAAASDEKRWRSEGNRGKGKKFEAVLKELRVKGNVLPYLICHLQHEGRLIWICGSGVCAGGGRRSAGRDAGHFAQTVVRADQHRAGSLLGVTLFAILPETFEEPGGWAVAIIAGPGFRLCRLCPGQQIHIPCLSRVRGQPFRRSHHAPVQRNRVGDDAGACRFTARWTAWRWRREASNRKAVRPPAMPRASRSSWRCACIRYRGWRWGVAAGGGVEPQADHLQRGGGGATTLLGGRRG